jgi:membrane-associated phospholipid phosphatase
MPRLFSTDTGPDFSRTLVALPVIVAALLMIPVLHAANNMELFLWLNGAHTPWLDMLWAHATMAGDTLLALVFLYAIGFRNPWIVWSGLVAAVLATLLVHGMKDLLLIARPAAVLQPELVHVVGPVLKKYSFPSGHSTTAFTLAAIVCLHTRLAAVRAAAFGLAVAIGLSRIGVGAHWPLDVLAGAIGGWIAGVTGTRLAYHWTFGVARPAQIAWTLILIGCVAAILLRRDPIIEATRVFQYVFALAAGAFGLLGAWNRLRTKTSTDTDAP